MAFCGDCGAQHEENVGFCPNCGKQFQVTKPEPEQVLFSAVVEQKRKEELALLEEQRKAAQAEKLAERKAKTDAQIEKLKAKFNERKPLWLSVTGVVALGVIYLTTQLVIFNVNGPEAKLNEYVSAIHDGDFSALDDETLFPGANNDTPAAVSAGYDSLEVSGAHFSNIQRSGLSATADVYATDSQESPITISLEATNNFNGLFQVPVWTVTSEPVPGNVMLRADFSNTQTVTFGGSTSVSVNEARSLGSFYYLPGFYRYAVDAYGFISSADAISNSWDAYSSGGIDVKADDNFSYTATALADRRALATAKSCARKKCRKLPRLNVYDFNLWSQYDRSTYTNSKFNYKYKVNSCTQSGVSTSSALTAQYTYTCSVTARGHLYVRYVYYYGYYSDYWYYWNFYDSREETLSVVVYEKTNAAGTKVKVTKSAAQ